MIPKVIHYCWFGGQPIPEHLEKCIKSWGIIMPDYEVRRWDESNYDVNKCQYTKDAYAAKKWAFVSDYARLDICYTHGGIYLDTDVEAVRKFDDLLSLQGFCGQASTNKPNLEMMNTGLVLGMERGLEIGRVLRDDYHQISFKDETGNLNLTPCPMIQTNLLKNYGYVFDNKKQCVLGLTIFPTDYFDPMDQYTGEVLITENTYSVHHYAATWNAEEDQERRRLRIQYAQRGYGKIGANVLSTIVAYKRRFGLLGMWKKIYNKLR